MKRFRNILCLIISALLLLPVFTVFSCAEDCEHDYKATLVPPTCVEDGYTLYVCTKCGDNYKDYAGAQTALGHNYGEWYKIDDASCIKEGHMERVCARCGASEIKTIPASGHKDADFNGICDVCGAKVKVKLLFAPFDWFRALFKAIADWFARLFG